MIQPKIVRPKEACRLLGVKKTTLYKWLKMGRVKRVRIGARMIGVTMESIEWALAHPWIGRPTR